MYGLLERYLKNIVNKLVISMILSIVLFNLVHINSTLYFFIVASVWVLVLLNYKFSSNLEFFDIIIIINLGNFVSYVLISNLLPDIPTIFYLGFFALISVLSFISKFLERKVILESPDLMVKRKKDLEGLLYYLDRFNIVGLNGRWGTGKSFLIDRMKEEIVDEYEIIEIDLLTCTLNELQLTLIREIERIMYRNGLISKYSNKLKSFLTDESFPYKIHGLFFGENKSYSETIKGLQYELDKLDKKLLIIYEDIDRISNINIIKNMFGISEKLSNQRIKIIYQYSEIGLFDMGFSPEYIEKYIPFKMNLTESDFFEILGFKFKDSKYDEVPLSIKDFNFLREYSQFYRYNVLFDEFGIEKEINLVIKYVTVRKVETFLEELSSILKKDRYSGHKETVISFFLVKHFIPEVYKQFNIAEGLLDTLTFKIDSKSYTILELINMYRMKEIQREDIEKAFKSENDNQINYCVLKLFNYNNINLIDYKTPEERLKAIFEESARSLKDRSDNDKKDRLVWNLLAHGKSHHTDYEYVGREFIKQVLDHPEEELESRYQRFNRKISELDNPEMDNRTIFKMGIPLNIELFKSFSILNVTDKQQIGLVDFYFEKDNIDTFNGELIQILNYCGLKSKKEYIHILKKLNKLEVIGNLNSEKYFVKFLKKYLGAISGLGYANVIEESYRFIFGDSLLDRNEATSSLERIINQLDRVKEKINKFLNIEELETELTIIISFIHKLLEIINCECKVPVKKYGFNNTSFSSRHKNQEEYDRLLTMEFNGDEFREEIKNSYLDDKITIYEIVSLLDSLPKD